MTLQARKLAACLKRKLDAKESSGAKHVKYRVFCDGHLVAVTFMSHGAKEIDDTLLGMMAKQLCIPKRVLRRLYDCPATWEEYKESYDETRSPRVGFGNARWR